MKSDITEESMVPEIEQRNETKQSCKQKDLVLKIFLLNLINCVKGNKEI